MRHRLHLALVLGVAHGVGDGAAGLLLGGLARSMPVQEVALLVLMYNALAFGGQPLVGMAVDRAGRPRLAALAGLLLTAAGLLLAAQQPRLAVALAGAGGALFHVGGGALALLASGGRAAGPGLFAAPGVVGLAAGGALAAAGADARWGFGLALLALAWAVGRMGQGTQAAVAAPEGAAPAGAEAHGFDAHDLVMVVLLAAIALRSLVWSTVDMLFHGRYDALLALACAAALGKLLGGPLADRLGWRRYTVGALACAAPLLMLAQGNLALLLPGVALLQSATPAALAALGRQLPRAPGTAAGLGLGLTIAIGGVPAVAGLGQALAAPPLLAALCMAAALAMWLGQRRGAGRGRSGLVAGETDAAVTGVTR